MSVTIYITNHAPRSVSSVHESTDSNFQFHVGKQEKLISSASQESTFSKRGLDLWLI